MNIMKALTAALSAAIFLGTGLAACSPEPNILDRAKANGMADAQVLACHDLVRRAQTTDPADAGARIQTARTVNESALSAGQPLSTAGHRLTLAADSGDRTAWTSAVDYMASECIALGWPAK